MNTRKSKTKKPKPQVAPSDYWTRLQAKNAGKMPVPQRRERIVDLSKFRSAHD
jgi:hypothetical protein